MDETKLTKKEKEELVEDTRELMLGLVSKIIEMLEELADKIEKC